MEPVKQVLSEAERIDAENHAPKQTTPSSPLKSPKAEKTTPKRKSSKSEAAGAADEKENQTSRRPNMIPPGKKTLKLKKMKAVKDPNRPKQPSSAFFLYMNEARENIKAANPDFTNPELSKEASRRWNNEMSEEEKAPYVKRHDEAKLGN